MSPTAWSTVLFFSLGVVALSIPLILGFPHRKAGLLLGILSAAVLTLAAGKLERAADARDWVITTESTTLQLSPAASAPAVRPLAKGVQLTQTGAHHGDFLGVRTGVTKGWVRTGAVRPVVVE